MSFIPVLSNTSFALPLLILLVAAAFWWWTTRASTPPYLRASPPYRSWRVNPVAAAYSSLHDERYLLAAFLLRERVATLAESRFGVASEQLRSWATGPDAPELPAPLSMRRVLRDLARAYQSAYLAEGSLRWDFFASATLAARRRRAARDFERAARDVEQVVAAWGTPA
jgi:hypothetical protein